MQIENEGGTRTTYFIQWDTYAFDFPDIKCCQWNENNELPHGTRCVIYGAVNTSTK